MPLASKNKDVVTIKYRLGAHSPILFTNNAQIIGVVPPKSALPKFQLTATPE
jgi:hypothetical protein